MPVWLQQALDDCQPLCPGCGLAMHRHHWYARTITTSYGTIRLRTPVFRYLELDGLWTRTRTGVLLIYADIGYSGVDCWLREVG